jgi:flagellar capping protein FliD
MENAIDGISLNLKAKGTVNVKVERDEASVNSTIKSFVEDYNKIIETVNTYTKSSEDKAAALSGNSATRSMVSRLRGVIGAEYGSSNYNTLSRLGITTNREGGTLKIDQKKLDKALEDDFDAVSKLFLGDESNSQIGMMDQMMLVLDDYHKNGGTYDRRIDQLEINNKQIAEDREKLDSRMEAKTLSLRSYYARMDTQIAQMNQTQNMLVSMLM